MGYPHLPKGTVQIHSCLYSFLFLVHRCAQIPFPGCSRPVTILSTAKPSNSGIPAKCDCPIAVGSCYLKLTERVILSRPTSVSFSDDSFRRTDKQNSSIVDTVAFPGSVNGQILGCIQGICPMGFFSVFSCIRLCSTIFTSSQTRTVQLPQFPFGMTVRLIHQQKSVHKFSTETTTPLVNNSGVLQRTACPSCLFTFSVN